MGYYMLSYKKIKNPVSNRLKVSKEMKNSERYKKFVDAIVEFNKTSPDVKYKADICANGNVILRNRLGCIEKTFETIEKATLHLKISVGTRKGKNDSIR